MRRFHDPPHRDNYRVKIDKQDPRQQPRQSKRASAKKIGIFEDWPSDDGEIYGDEPREYCGGCGKLTELYHCAGMCGWRFYCSWQCRYSDYAEHHKYCKPATKPP